MSDTYSLYLKVREKFSKKEIGDKINVNKNTIDRWEILKVVPTHYQFDLYELLGEKIDYTQFTEKEKDQFFTSKDTVTKCMNILYDKLSELEVEYENYDFIEPSAGDGSFYLQLPEGRRIGLDIEPRHDEIIESNFLNWYPETEKPYITVGNPPFGLRGNLALRFINHSSKFSEFTAFILPQIFESNGKGNCMSRVESMNLIHSERVESDFHYPNGEEVKVNVIFQIWSKNFKNVKDEKSASNFIKIYSVSNGGTPSTTRNMKMWYKCDFYLPTTCFNDKMKLYYSFDELPQKRGYGIVMLKNKEEILKIFEDADWKQISFVSTNGALNLRFDLIEKLLIDNGYIDE